MKNNIIYNNFTLLVLLSAIWGSAFIAIKISVESTNPITVASVRLIIGALFLYFYYKYKKLNLETDYKTLFNIILIGLIGNLIPFFLISWSEQFIQSNTAGMLLTVAPLFTIIIAHFSTKNDKFSFKKLIGILIGLIGVSLIFGIDNLTGILSGYDKYFIPKIAIIIAALGYVISSILAYKIKNINTITLTTFVTISAAFCSLPFMLYVEVVNYSLPSFNSLLALLYLGLFPTAIAFLLRFHIISKAGPTFLSYVAYLIPSFAIFWGYIFLEEKITINIVFGLMFIFFGIFIGQYSNENKN